MSQQKQEKRKFFLLKNGLAVTKNDVVFPNGKSVSLKNMSNDQKMFLIKSLSSLSPDQLNSIAQDYQASGGDQSFKKTIEDSAKSVGSGLLQAGANAVDIEGRLASEMSSAFKEGMSVIGQSDNPAAQAIQSDMDAYKEGLQGASGYLQGKSNEIYKEVPKNLTNEASRLAGEIAPSLAIPSELPEMAGAEATGVLPRAASFVARSAPAGAMQAALAANPGNIGESAAAGAVLGPLVGGAFNLARFGGRSLKELAPSLTTQRYAKKLAQKTPVSSSQIERALAASGGQDALVGSALNLPEIQQFEVNTLPTIPGLSGGILTRFGDIEKGMLGQASQIMENLTIPDATTEEIGSSLMDYLQTGERNASREASRLYKIPSDILQNNNVPFSFPNLLSQSKELKDMLGNQESMFGTPYNKVIDQRIGYLLDSDALNPESVGEKALDKQNIGAEENKPQNVSLAQIKRVISGLYKEASGAKVRGDATSNMVFSELGSALNKDLEENINALPDEGELQTAKEGLKKANDYWKENVLPYRQAPYPKILAGKVDPDTIAKTFLPKTQKTRVNLVKQFIKNAPSPADGAPTAKLLLTPYLNEAVQLNKFNEYEISPKKLYGLLQNLGEERLDALTGGNEEIKQLTRDFRSSYQLNKDALDIMANRPTGKTTVSDINRLYLSELGGDIMKSLLKFEPKEAIGTAFSASRAYAGGRHLANPELLSRIAKIKSQIESGETKGSKKEAKKTLDRLQKLLVSTITSSIGGAV